MAAAASGGLTDRKRFHGREWVFLKLAHCLRQRPIAKTCGVVIVGGPGCGKTALCTEMVWPGLGRGCRAQRILRRRLLAHHFCQGFNACSLSPSEFVRRIVSQLLGQYEDEANCYDGDPKSLTTSSLEAISARFIETMQRDPETQEALRPDFIDRDPDEAFKKGVLFPLLEIDPPKHCMFLLVDSIDESQLSSPSDCKFSSVESTRSEGRSKTIAELLGSHHHLFPQWLMLVCTSRKQSKNISKLFTGFRKLSLDDLRKSHVVRDVQQYILSRIHGEDGLRIGMRLETAEMLNQLQIKSAGCFLYLERVLDGLAERLMLLRDLREIPGTLNGLYLWLCQRLLNAQQLAKVQPILNVILASRRPLTISEVYDAVWTHNTNMSRQNFTNRLHLLRRVLRLHNNGTLLLFHQSFAEWLLDVKHCTKKYLCSADQGHAMLAMSMTLRAKTLPPDEIQNFALHLTRIPLPNQTILNTLPVDYNTLIVLWLIQSGAKVENCLLADEKPVKKVRKPSKTTYEKLDECYEELEFEPYGRRDLKNDDYDHLEFDLAKSDKSPEFLKELNDRNFKFSAGEPKLDSEDSGFVRSEGASTLGVPTATTLSSNEPGSEMTKEEELELLLSGLEQSLNNDGSFNQDDVTIPKDPKVLMILTEAGAKMSNCNSLTKDSNPLTTDGIKSSQASRTGSPHDPLQELIQALKSEGDPVDAKILHAVCMQDNPTMLQLVLSTYPDIDLEAVDKHGQTALNLAARHGHLQILDDLLSAGANINHTDCDGWTALRAAAWGGHTSIVELLLRRGAAVDIADSDQRTALRAAAWGGHEPIVKLLIEFNADVNHTDDEGRTALIAASYMGHAAIVERLLDAGAELDHEDCDGRTALSVAALCVPCSEGYLKVVNLLLERGAEVDHTDKDSMTPLLMAAFENHKDVCELLLEYEADVDHADRSGRTPLWAAASCGHDAVVALLLFWGCYVDSIDNEGRTVLSVAAAQGNTAVVRQLLDRGLDEQHRDNSGWTPLHYAAFEGHIEVCEALLECGAKIDEPDNDGKGPLMLAAQEGHTSLVQVLLDVYGASPDQKAHDGKTALRLAALEGHYEIVRTLLTHSADINAKDADGRTTLYILALENRLPMVRFLLEHGRPDVEARDNEGRTALHVSAWRGHLDMVRLLLAAGRADVKAVDADMRTALHSASWQGHAAIVRVLLDCGAVVDHMCNQGATALGVAAQEGHEECVKVLLEAGANPSHSDRCGRNALRVAAKSGHDAVVKLLQDHSCGSSPRPWPTEISGSTLDYDESNRQSYLSLTQHSTNSKSSSNLSNSTKSSQEKISAQLNVSQEQEIKRRSNVKKQPRPASTSALSPLDLDATSPIYASPPHSPLSDLNSPETEMPPTSFPPASATDLHFSRDTHMRIILGNTRHEAVPSQKSKRNGIVTNPALRLMSNVKNGLENAAERIQRRGQEVTRLNLAKPRDSSGKVNGLNWKKETPL